MAVGMIYFMLTLVLGSVCGAHFNPAVTIGVLIANGREDFTRNLVFAGLTIIAQIIGAISGAIIVWILSSNAIPNKIMPLISIMCPQY